MSANKSTAFILTLCLCSLCYASAPRGRSFRATSMRAWYLNYHALSSHTPRASRSAADSLASARFLISSLELWKKSSTDSKILMVTGLVMYL